MSAVSVVFNSAFGRFDIPIDIWTRSVRWAQSRPDYLEDWCRWQYQKANHG